MVEFTRRAFAGLVALPLAVTAARPAFAVSRRAISTAGTTLEHAATPVGDSGYRRLTAGPGWPLVSRADVVAGVANRDDRRTALTSFVQLTDLHVVDAQSPARFEYLHQLGIGSAFRPQETLSAQGASRLVARVNALQVGPYSGRQFDAVISTGDNTDNHEALELDWFLTVLNGGQLTPNSGDLNHYEGVQDSNSTDYWNPESSINDIYKQKGFPRLTGLLGAAIAEFDTVGLRTPWYSCFGNHDDSIAGTLPSNTPVIESFYTGSTKIEGFATEQQNKDFADAYAKHPTEAMAKLSLLDGLVREVTSDVRRKPYTPTEYITKHLETGGHGFTENNLDAKT
jgi:metallophosphoesterase (TIGR03767 family)